MTASPTAKAQSAPQLQPTPVALPEGWIKTESNGASIYRPCDVPAGKLYFVIAFPEEPLGKKSLTQWFNSRIDTVLAKAGSLIQRGTVEQKTPKALTCTSTFVPASGGQMLSVFTAVSPRSGQGRLCILTSTSDTALMERYKTATAAITQGFLTPQSENKKPKENPSPPSADKSTARAKQSTPQTKVAAAARP
ncbi:MAG: hypothetical protein V4671_05195 [Armatimonadota bacterium]